ncbi:MAG: hypothetical protein Q8P95_04120 [bacterium]|nr:hypothetical protein [bacterium]
MSGQYQPSAAEREASEIVREFADKDPSKLDDADLKLLLERTRKEILLMDERQRVELSALGPELTERLRDKGVLTRSVMVKTFLEQFRDRLEETLKSRITSTPASLLTRVLRTAGLASVGSVLTVLLALAAGERVNEVRAREARGTADDNAIKLDLNKQREAAQAGQIAAEQQKSELEKMLNDVIRELEGEIFRLRYDLLLAKHIIYAGGFHFQDLERQLKEKEEALRLAREAEQKLRDQLAQAGLSQPDVPQPQGPIAVPVAPEGVNLEDLGQRLSEAGKSGDREQMREVVAEVLMNIESFRTLSETIRAVIIDHYTPGGTYECRISPNEGGAFSTRCDNWESFRTGSIGSPGNFLPGQFDGKRILRVKPDEVSILLALPEWIKNLWVNYYARRSQEA